MTDKEQADYIVDYVLTILEVEVERDTSELMRDSIAKGLRLNTEYWFKEGQNSMRLRAMQSSSKVNIACLSTLNLPS